MCITHGTEALSLLVITVGCFNFVLSMVGWTLIMLGVVVFSYIGTNLACCSRRDLFLEEDGIVRCVVVVSLHI